MTAQKFIEKKFFNRHFFLVAINENERDVIEFIADLMNEYTEQLRQSNVVGRTEQLPILDRCGCEEPNEEPIKVCMNCNGYVE